MFTATASDRLSSQVKHCTAYNLNRASNLSLADYVNAALSELVMKISPLTPLCQHSQLDYLANIIMVLQNTIPFHVLSFGKELCFRKAIFNHILSTLIEPVVVAICGKFVSSRENLFT